MNFEERKHGFKLSEIAFRLSGKKAVIQKENIKGKELELIITFPNKKTYEKEYKDWIEFQDKTFKEREKEQNVEGFKIYKTLKEKTISYSDFVKISAPFISRVLFQTFNDNQSLFAGKKDTVQIKITSTPRWEYDEAEKRYKFLSGFPYSMPEPFVKQAMKGEIMDLEHYYVAFSVFYILQAIVAPYVYLKKIDYNFLYRYFMHEFEHYKQLAEGLYLREYELGIRINPHMSRSSDYTLQYLWWTICALQKEGLAEYRKMINTPKIMIIPNYHKNFKNLLKELTNKKTKKETEDYFNNKLYSGTPEGVYYCGTIMAFIVAYSFDPKSAYILREKNESAGVFDKTPGLELTRLAEKFKSGEKFFITTPSKNAYEKTYEMLSKASPEEYILLYEEACKKLELKGEAILITTKFLKKLWADSEYIFEKNELEKLKKEGFYPRW